MQTLLITGKPSKALDSREEFHERTKLVFEMSKIYKFRAASRMHISCWDKSIFM